MGVKLGSFMYFAMNSFMCVQQCICFCFTFILTCRHLYRAPLRYCQPKHWFPQRVVYHCFCLICLLEWSVGQNMIDVFIWGLFCLRQLTYTQKVVNDRLMGLHLAYIQVVVNSRPMMIMLAHLANATIVNIQHSNHVVVLEMSVVVVCVGLPCIFVITEQ